jgi:hypothetical protein
VVVEEIGDRHGRVGRSRKNFGEFACINMFEQKNAIAIRPYDT